MCVREHVERTCAFQGGHRDHSTILPSEEAPDPPCCLLPLEEGPQGQRCGPGSLEVSELAVPESWTVLFDQRMLLCVFSAHAFLCLMFCALAPCTPHPVPRTPCSSPCAPRPSLFLLLIAFPRRRPKE